MQPHHLFRLPDAKFVHHTAGAAFFGDGSLHAAAGKQLLGHAGGQFLLGLEHKALGVEILGKTGDAVSRRADAAVLLQLQTALRDLFPRLGCKTHVSFLLFLPVSGKRHGAGRRADSQASHSIPRSSAQR